VIHSAALTSGIQEQCNKTISIVQFWTDQLKRAALTRYGPVANSIDVVRQLLHHTKQIVRGKEGKDLLKIRFI
jgi:hypothetical protein